MRKHQPHAVKESSMVGMALTKEQFLTLMKMIYIANTVANGRKDDHGFLKKYDELEQYIFARAREAGFNAATLHHVIDGEEHNHPSRIFEGDKEIAKIMDQYDADTFWDELAIRLAERDVEATFTMEAKTGIPPEHYKAMIDERAKVYDEEFLKHELGQLHIDGIEELK